MFWMRPKFLTKSGSKELTWLPSVQAQLWILGWCQLWLGPGACLTGSMAQQYQSSNPPQKGQSQQGKEKKKLKNDANIGCSLKTDTRYAHGGHPSIHKTCAGPHGPDDRFTAPHTGAQSHQMKLILYCRAPQLCSLRVWRTFSYLNSCRAPSRAERCPAEKCWGFVET